MESEIECGELGVSEILVDGEIQDENRDRGAEEFGDEQEAESIDDVVAETVMLDRSRGEKSGVPGADGKQYCEEAQLAQAGVAAHEVGGEEAIPSSVGTGGEFIELETSFGSWDERGIDLNELDGHNVNGIIEEEGNSEVLLENLQIEESDVTENGETQMLSSVDLLGKDAIRPPSPKPMTFSVSIFEGKGQGAHIAVNGHSLIANDVEVVPSVQPSADRVQGMESVVIENLMTSRYVDCEVKSDSVGNSTSHPDEMHSSVSLSDHVEAEEDGHSLDINSVGDVVTLHSERSASSFSEPVVSFGSVVEDLARSRTVEVEQNEAPSTQPALVEALCLENDRAPSLPSRPAGLGSSDPLHNNAARSVQQTRPNGSVSVHQSLLTEEAAGDDVDENKETHEKLQMIRVKFLRLAHRLGQTPHNVVVAQVLYRLGLAEQLWKNTNRTGVFGYDRANVMAEQLEAAGQDPLDFSCTILAIGKSGVGKSTTINSIIDNVHLSTDAFQPSTKKVQDVVGTVQGIKVRVIDMPGLSPSSYDQLRNEKILQSVKKFINKSPPDIVLYFDRLDMQTRDYGDVPLLRTITTVFGSSIWFNAIVVLTHAASAPPDGPNGNPLTYEMFVTQRSHVIQQAIRQAAGDVRLMNPVSLVENHSACRTNRAGQRVLPNGQVWKPQLLLLSFASKILAEANMLLKLQDSPPGKPMGSRARVPPLPFLLSNLLQTKPQPRLPQEQFSDDDPVDDDLDEGSDSSGEVDYDDLPPFRRLTNFQLAKLSKEQKKAYYEELEYREKLYFKKQMKEEKIRHRLMKKMKEAAKNLPSGDYVEDLEEESSGPASVPVPLPDLVLPHSFDSDYPSHRYRFLDTSNLWLIRPVLETQGWDHDVGYDGLNVERSFVLKDKIPVSASGQLTKDKKEFNVQMELGASVKHAKGSTSLGMDAHTIGKDMVYTLRGETRFKNFGRNNTAAGIALAVLGDTVSTGMKIEDKLWVNKRLKLIVSGGAMTGRGDVAYGGRLEATLRDKDYPIGQALTTLAVSLVDWHGEQVIGCNLQSQIPIGRGTSVMGHANVSNRGSGQVGIRVNSSEHLQMALLVLLPLFRHVKRLLLGFSESA